MRRPNYAVDHTCRRIAEDGALLCAAPVEAGRDTVNAGKRVQGRLEGTNAD